MGICGSADAACRQLGSPRGWKPYDSADLAIRSKHVLRITLENSFEEH